MHDPRWVRILASAYRRAVRLLVPAEFRRRFGEELVEAFLDAARERYSRRGPLGLAGVLVHAGVDLVWLAITERRVERTRSDRWMAGFGRDLRNVAGVVVRRPILPGLAVLVIALGVSSYTVMSTVVRQVLVRPLPFTGGDRIVYLYERQGTSIRNPSSESITHWAAAAPVFDALAVFRTRSHLLTGGQHEPRRIIANQVSPDVLSLLSIRPMFGRTFTRDDMSLTATPVALLTEGFWREEFGADRDVLGRSLDVADGVYTIIGVLPAAYDIGLGFGSHMWVPSTAGQSTDGSGSVIARLGSGVSVVDARSRLEAIGVGGVGRDRGWLPQISRPQDQFMGPNGRTALWLLYGATALVLVVAGINLTHMLFVRNQARGCELQVRQALGASRRRLLQLILIEGALLGFFGGIAAFWLSIHALKVLDSVRPEYITLLGQVRPDVRTLVHTLAIATAGGIAAASFPALRLTRSLSHTGRGRRPHPSISSSASRGWGGSRVMVSGQAAGAMVLLIGAGLCGLSYQNVRQVNPGWNPDRLVTASITLPNARYRDDAQRAVFFGALLDGLRSAPGIESATLSAGLIGGRQRISFGGTARSAGMDEPDTEFVYGSHLWPGYFRDVEGRLVNGREFSEEDVGGAGGPASLIVNEAFAARYWPDRSALGQRIELEDRGYEVVGVVESVTTHQAERSRLQAFAAFGGIAGTPRFALLAVRGSHSIDEVVRSIKARVWVLDSELPVENIVSGTDLLARAIGQFRFNLVLFAALGIVALCLAAAGLYGIVSTEISRRVRELGVRVVLGADRSHILGIVARAGLIPVAIGVGVGVGAATG